MATHIPIASCVHAKPGLVTFVRVVQRIYQHFGPLYVSYKLFTD